MSFTLTPLADETVLVDGTDVRGKTGSTVLDATEWNTLQLETKRDEVAADFDAAIEQFLAPIKEAADKARAALAKPELDPLLYVTVSEATEATPGSARVIRKLADDTVILRALNEGLEDRVIWVGDKLVLTAAPATQPAPAVQDAVDLGSLDS